MTQMSDENTIECPYCGEWQHLDNINKEVLVKDWKYVILKCEDCGEGYRAGIDVEYRWVIEKLPKKEIKEDTELIDVPGQLFFSFYES